MAKKPDIEADRKAAPDRREPIGLMEPLLLSEGCRARRPLADLALELAQNGAVS
jgi:hypothetical protein